MARAAKKPHPADVADAARELTAVGFRVHFRKGPFERYDEDAPDLAAAYDTADRLNAAHGEHGRRAIIYAILPNRASFAIKQQTRP